MQQYLHQKKEAVKYVPHVLMPHMDYTSTCRATPEVACHLSTDLYIAGPAKKINTKSYTEAEVVGLSDYLPYNIWICLFI